MMTAITTNVRRFASARVGQVVFFSSTSVSLSVLLADFKPGSGLGADAALLAPLAVMPSSMAIALPIDLFRAEPFRSDRTKVAGAERLELPTYAFGERRSTN